MMAQVAAPLQIAVSTLGGGDLFRIGEMIDGCRLERQMGAARGGDGDPLDVIILGPTLPRGSVVPAHVIGVLKMLNDGEQDDKLLAVMEGTPFGKVRSLVDLERNHPGALEIVKLYFEHYKGPGADMVLQRVEEADEARSIVTQAAEDYGAAMITTDAVASPR